VPFSERRMHKEVVGVLVVSIDFLCILIMIYFFKKLEALNNEFLEKVDDLKI
jgi:hypothetical protein